MRKIINLNQNWLFAKNTSDVSIKEGDFVNLPHTWNAEDGFDGGNDYFRGTCVYTKLLNKSELPEADLYYVEFRGANSSADLFVNGEKLFHHDGGYSTWRVNITEQISDETTLAVVVDNSPSDEVYPQMADFTFYGGLYRDVNLICVNNAHFDLDYYGAPGLMITPEVSGDVAKVRVEAFVKNLKDSQSLVYTIYDREENEISRIESDRKSVV